ncbi:MAG: CidA/LrgA family protein [Clostridia bacterium]|nr:CidA/LrgA family protein [Clostridia bacterium]
MKYLKQLMIILLFSFIGEVLNTVIPLPIPASIYGMLLLFIALSLKIVKLEQVKETSEYFLSIMLILFVPAAVGIMDAFFQFKAYILPILLIILVSTFAVMLVTGSVSQLVAKIPLFSKKEEKLLEAEKEGEK